MKVVLNYGLAESKTEPSLVKDLSGMRSDWIVKYYLDYRRDKSDEDFEFCKDWFDEYDSEICLVRKNNKLGITSGGWDGPDKIIASGGIRTFKDFELRKKQAQVMADALNKANL